MIAIDGNLGIVPSDEFPCGLPLLHEENIII